MPNVLPMLNNLNVSSNFHNSALDICKLSSRYPPWEWSAKGDEVWEWHWPRFLTSALENPWNNLTYSKCFWNIWCVAFGFSGVFFTMMEEITDDAINNLLFRWTWVCKLFGPINLSTAPWGHPGNRDKGREKTRQGSGSHMEGLLATAHAVHSPGCASIPSAKTLPWGIWGCERVLEGQKARKKNFTAFSCLYSHVLAPSLN